MLWDNSVESYVALLLPLHYVHGGHGYTVHTGETERHLVLVQN